MNSRQKGKKGENELAKLLSDALGVQVVRNLQQTREGGYDLIVRESDDRLAKALDRFAIEVKRNETITPANIAKWWTQAASQARKAEKVPCMAYNPNRGEWRLIVPLSAVLEGYPEDEQVEMSISGFCALVKQFDPLTGKQRRFVQEYLIDLNATQAAIRAGYSQKTAYSIGNQNLKKLEIQAALQKAQTERAERTNLSGDVIVHDLLTLKEMVMGRLPMRKTMIIEGKSVEIEVREVNPMAAKQTLELLGKHRDLKLFSDKVEQEMTFNVTRKAWDSLKSTMDLPSQRHEYTIEHKKG